MRGATVSAIQDSFDTYIQNTVFAESLSVSLEIGSWTGWMLRP